MKLTMPMMFSILKSLKSFRCWRYCLQSWMMWSTVRGSLQVVHIGGGWREKMCSCVARVCPSKSRFTVVSSVLEFPHAFPMMGVQLSTSGLMHLNFPTVCFHSAFHESSRRRRKWSLRSGGLRSGIIASGCVFVTPLNKKMFSWSGHKRA